MTKLEGLQAPEFSLPNEKGETVSLKDFAGEKYVVLYFYPKDSTPGCTTQACDFRDAFEDFSKLNAVVLGVSPDSDASHEKFIGKHGLPFSLLVDADHTVAEKYDVWKLKKMFGKEYMGMAQGESERPYRRSTCYTGTTDAIIRSLGEREWKYCSRLN